MALPPSIVELNENFGPFSLAHAHVALPGATPSVWIHPGKIPVLDKSPDTRNVPSHFGTACTLHSRGLIVLGLAAAVSAVDERVVLRVGVPAQPAESPAREIARAPMHTRVRVVAFMPGTVQPVRAR